MDKVVCPRCEAEGKIEGKVSIGWITSTCRTCGWSHSTAHDKEVGLKENVESCLESYRQHQLGAGYRQPKKQ